VVVDRFSKYAHFIPLSHPFSAPQVAQAFFDNIYRLHGLPTHIISDRDKIFTSLFWRELFRLSHTTLAMSSAYHPQTDDQTERVNQCLETFLRCFVSSCPRKWIKYVTLAEFWYNTSHHSSINMTPFEVLYGILLAISVSLLILYQLLPKWMPCWASMPRCYLRCVNTFSGPSNA